MSQHHFDTTHEGRPIRVVIGWDRPLHYAFMYIERKDKDDDEVTNIYSNLDDGEIKDLYQRPGLKPFERYREVPRHLGIQVPESMFVQTKADYDGNVGNRMARHSADSTFKELM